jgi:hypothetical protein
MNNFPFLNCVGCNKPIEEIGGKRIIKSNKGGVILLHKNEPFFFFGIHDTSVCFFINVDSTRNLFAWGDYRFIREFSWKSNIKEIKRIIIEENRIPWVCQNCIQLEEDPFALVLDNNGFSSYL